MESVVVIDYGIVNLKNILRGFEYVGARVESTIDPDRVLKADRVILPGVGAFESGMSELRALGMDEAVKSVARAGRPVLGICLGMQMLLDKKPGIPPEKEEFQYQHASIEPIRRFPEYP